jgi:hypothetical protein
LVVFSCAKQDLVIGFLFVFSNPLVTSNNLQVIEVLLDSLEAAHGDGQLGVN